MDVYQRVTDTIIDQLETGTIPWRRPWRTNLPKNLISGNTYRGINLLVLGLSSFSSAYWATFRQIKKLGGSVCRGEKGTHVVYMNFRVVEDKETGEDKRIPIMRGYTVFNLDQTTGIEAPVDHEARVINPIDACAQIVGSMPDERPSIDFDGGSRAYYYPATDSIHLPMQTAFHSAEAYYSTLFHELVHSTGHAKRLARKGVADETARFGTETYSQEELVAEIGAAYLNAMARIDTQTVENSSAYIAGWLERLRSDRKLVVIAAGQAQKAVDYICQAEQKAEAA